MGRVTDALKNNKEDSLAQHQHTHFLWDGDKPIQEYSDTHVYTTIYDQGSFAPIARAVWLKEGVKLAANDNHEDGYLNFDDPYAKPKLKQADIQVFHYHNDQLGTPNELTNQDGEVVWLADYEAW